MWFRSTDLKLALFDQRAIPEKKTQSTRDTVKALKKRSKLSHQEERVRGHGGLISIVHINSYTVTAHAGGCEFVIS